MRLAPLALILSLLLSVDAFGAERTPSALAATKALAEMGGSHAQRALGEAYLRGEGVPKDPVAAEMRDEIVQIPIVSRRVIGG